MVRNIKKMKASPKAKNMNVAFWGKKTFTEKARENPNLKIGDKIPSAATRAKELEDIEKRIRGY